MDFFGMLVLGNIRISRILALGVFYIGQTGGAGSQRFCPPGKPTFGSSFECPAGKIHFRKMLPQKFGHLLYWYMSFNKKRGPVYRQRRADINIGQLALTLFGKPFRICSLSISPAPLGAPSEGSKIRKFLYIKKTRSAIWIRVVRFWRRDHFSQVVFVQKR